MKIAVVLTFNAPTPEDAATILSAIDPPRLPFFDGTARVTVDPWASALEAFLDRVD